MFFMEISIGGDGVVLDNRDIMVFMEGIIGDKERKVCNELHFKTEMKLFSKKYQ